MIVDDQTLFAESLRTVIKTEAPDMEVAAIAFDGRSAVRLAFEHRPDIILMDVRMPDMNGVECTRIIKQRLPDVQIMMLTTFDDDEFVMEALSLGAVGYLLKDIQPGFLLHAIRSVHRGGVLIAPKVARKIMERVNLVRDEAAERRSAEASGAKRAILDGLSLREREVLLEIARGLSNKEIADRMCIAEQTVKNHVSVVYSKLGVHDRLQALRLAIEAGLDQV
jgi:DNA-binding NarL/FixJ family response regulator